MLQKSSIEKVSEVFFKNPTKSFYLLDISRKTGIAHTSVKNNLELLEREKVVKKTVEIRGSRKFPIFKVNINSKEYKKYKKIFNYRQLIESGLIEFLEDNIMPKCIMLFGSYQLGEDVEDSDIDLYIQSDKVELNLKKFEKVLDRRIELHFSKIFSNYPKELQESIINGYKLHGFLELHED